MSTGHVAKKGGRWYPVVDFGLQSFRPCSTPKCRGGQWTAQQGTVVSAKCGSDLGDQVKRRRRDWHESYRLKSEALAALKVHGHSADQGDGSYARRSDQVTYTFGEYVEQEWLPKLDVRRSTAESYARNLRLHALPRLGSIPFRELRAHHFEGLFRELLDTGHKGHRLGEGLSLRTVRYLKFIMQKAIDDAVRRDYLTRNWASIATVPTPKVESPPRTMTTWSGPELMAFLEATKDETYGAAWFVLASTGMRRGELLGLRWDDLDTDTARVSISRALIAIRHRIEVGPTKTDRGRLVELDSRTMAVLKRHGARQAEDRLLLGPGYRDEGFIFCHADGRPFHPERFSREFERRQVRYNREHQRVPLPRLRLHDLRHTWASLALAAGVHVKVVQERLGHSTTTVTLNIYSHVLPGMQTRAAETVSDRDLRECVILRTEVRQKIARLQVSNTPFC